MTVSFDNKAVLNLRSEFPALQETRNGHAIHFFDGPGGTQVHGSVIDAMSRYLREANSNAHGEFLFSHRTDKTAGDARLALADFVNAPSPNEIVFGPNMTSLTFNMSRAVGKTLEPGDEIVLSRLDHDANIAPWLALQENGAVIRHVNFDPADCTLDMNAMESAITGKTKIVAVGYASNATGTINDVSAIADMAHGVGAWLYVDAVHYAPHGPIDVQAIDCDFLVCSTYKFFGPHLGALYGRFDLLDALPAYKVRPADNVPPGKFQTGTPNFEAMAGATAAIDYLASVGLRYGGNYQQQFEGVEGRRRDLKCAMSAIRAYETALCHRLVEGLHEIPGLTIYGIVNPSEFDWRVPTVSFTIRGLTPQMIARYLGEANIFAWNGNFYALSVTEQLGLEASGGMLRVGLNHYNTADEVDYLLGVLSDMPG
ncbi:MAG: cysteine desulfurase-like protein [Anaerolineae bacterium]|nr:cysteine desulfurase-like protein [Anaerolineae bacterium]